MCDTMVCLPSVTLNGKLIFAKNSDRSPNEPHIIERIPAQNHDLGKNPEIKTTYIKVAQVPRTLAVTFFKPSWIWGAEMGFNEYGVNIGNEAVFTKAKKGEDALTGMDLLRLALERSKTAIEALNIITDLLAEYGQGGNCGYDKNFHYHNSFLISDREEAYVLETAGYIWAAEKVKDIYAISNGLTIEGDFDYAHEDVIKERKRTKNYSFRKKYSNTLFTYFAQAKGRRSISESLLERNRGNITTETVISVLRSHNTDIENKACVGSVCMHAGGIIGDHTTGAYVAEIGTDDAIYYATGASLPCMSMFKPLLAEKVDGDLTERGEEYWYRREFLNRYFLSGQGNLKEFRMERDKLERELFAEISGASEAELPEIVKNTADKEENLINKYLGPLKDTPHKFSLGKRGYRKYWEKKTAELEENYLKFKQIPG